VAAGHRILQIMSILLIMFSALDTSHDKWDLPDTQDNFLKHLPCENSLIVEKFGLATGVIHVSEKAHFAH
jgi:hypothetical protein